jgi:DNA-binding MarR family transcriptional regulator
MSEPPLTPLLQELIRLAIGLAHRMGTHLTAVSAEFGLSTIEGRALFLLDSPRSMSELAGDIRCDASYITIVTNHLEDEGLVERHLDPHDQRVKRLVITPKGRRVRHELQYRAEQDLPVAAGLTKAQQQTLRDLLATLAAQASKTSENPGAISQTVDETADEPNREDQTSERLSKSQRGFQ